jgi:hypothetical protein
MVGTWRKFMICVCSITLVERKLLNWGDLAILLSPAHIRGFRWQLCFYPCLSLIVALKLNHVLKRWSISILNILILNDWLNISLKCRVRFQLKCGSKGAISLVLERVLVLIMNFFLGRRCCILYWRLRRVVHGFGMPVILMLEV